MASHHPDVLVYLCRRQQDRVLVLLNLSKDTASFHFDHPAVAGNYTELFSNETISIGRKKDFTFKPGEYKVYHITG
ncbi:MAG: alpha-glucosidase C-terminal domain-containing protein [Bacteroidota bacterium]